MEAAGIAGDSQIGAEVIYAVDGKARPHPSRPRAKPRYRVTNWRDYNRALVARG